MSPAAASRWRDALSDERIAHLIKNAFRGTSSALQARLRKHSVRYGHWTLLRVLWQTDGLTQRELSEQAGVREPSTFAALQRMEQLGYVTFCLLMAGPYLHRPKRRSSSAISSGESDRTRS